MGLENGRNRAPLRDASRGSWRTPGRSGASGSHLLSLVLKSLELSRECGRRDLLLDAAQQREPLELMQTRVVCALQRDTHTRVRHRGSRKEKPSIRIFLHSLQEARTRRGSGSLLSSTSPVPLLLAFRRRCFRPGRVARRELCSARSLSRSPPPESEREIDTNTRGRCSFD